MSISLLRLPRSGTSKILTLTGLNAYFLWSFASSFISLTPLLMFALLGYFAIKTVEAKQSGFLLGFIITILVTIFIWLKGYSITKQLPSLEFSFITIGLSYILFRIIHLVVDVSQRAIPPPSILIYFNYIFFFLTFVSGPIQRFQDFFVQTNQPKFSETYIEIDGATKRIIKGFFLIIIACSVTAHLNQKLSISFFNSLSQEVSLKACMIFSYAALVQLIHLYCNFSGYTDICLGLGRLTGYTLPENFNAPFKSKNSIDFWGRWHISLSDWFKFYLFNPLLKTIMLHLNPKNNHSSHYIGAGAFFVTFLIMGLWHGSSKLFIFYGFFLGFSVSINKLWQVEFIKYCGKNGYNQLCKSPWYIHLTNAATLSYFTMALICVWITPTQAEAITFNTLKTASGAFLLLLVFFYLISYLRANVVQPTLKIIPKIKCNVFLNSILVGFLLLALIDFVITLGHKAPDFVYKAF